MATKLEMLAAVARYALAEMAVKGETRAENALRSMGAPSEAVQAILRDGFTPEGVAVAFRTEDGAFFGDTRHRFEAVQLQDGVETVRGFWPVPLAGADLCYSAAQAYCDGATLQQGGTFFVREVNAPDDGEEDAEEGGPDRMGWEVGNRAGAFDLGDRGEIVGFADGQDADGCALAILQLDFNTIGHHVTLSVNSLSILTDDVEA